LWGEALAELIGHVDARNRPIVSLSLPDQDDAFLVTVDTGFNRELLIHEPDIPRLRCNDTGVTKAVELAGGDRRSLRVARSRIIWFGRIQEVEVLIAPAERSRAALTDEPAGLLGTMLLSSHKLLVDFASRLVVISEPGAQQSR
jgi:predicted aspartyl protease